MAELTDAQLEILRGMAGDEESGADQLSKPRVQAMYEKALTFGADADATEARTVVYMLRWLMARARKKVDMYGEVENKKLNQIFTNIFDKLLPYYEKLAGMSGAGVMSIGTLDLGIDTDDNEDSDW